MANAMAVTWFLVVRTAVEVALLLVILAVALHYGRRIKDLEQKFDYLDRKVVERDRLARIFDEGREASRR